MPYNLSKKLKGAIGKPRRIVDESETDDGQPLVTHAGRPVVAGNIRCSSWISCCRGRACRAGILDTRSRSCRSAQRPLRRRAAGISGRACSRRPRPGGQGRRARRLKAARLRRAQHRQTGRNGKQQGQCGSRKVTELRGSDIGFISFTPSARHMWGRGGQAASPSITSHRALSSHGQTAEAAAQPGEQDAISWSGRA